MGLISKHGILIVEVAKESQAMVLGVMPLVLATGAGAASRFAMGLVIAAGLSIGTLFTLFVLPAVYMLLASHRQVSVLSLAGQ